MKQGKRGRTWERVRRSLKKEFDKKDIRFCELCGSTFGLGFAHSKKRRFIQTENDWREVALLCTPCHESLEVLPHSEMYERITDIIERR